MKQKSKNSEQLKKNTRSLYIIITLIVILLIALVYLIITGLPEDIPEFEKTAREYCNRQNVESVSICNGVIIETKLSLLGGGSSYHHKDGTTFSCPVIAPDEMSRDCKAISNAQQSNQWDCKKIC